MTVFVISAAVDNTFAFALKRRQKEADRRSRLRNPHWAQRRGHCRRQTRRSAHTAFRKLEDAGWLSWPYHRFRWRPEPHRSADRRSRGSTVWGTGRFGAVSGTGPFVIALATFESARLEPWVAAAFIPDVALVRLANMVASSDPQCVASSQSGNRAF